MRRMPANEWLDDPEIQAQIRARSVRNGILRSAILWTPFFVAASGALLFFLFDQVIDGGRGTIFLVIVLAVLSTLFGFQSVQAILDLFGEPKTLRGAVLRRWSKMDSLVMKTHYLRIEKTILRGDVDLIGGVNAGDIVEVRFYRHSAVVVGLKTIEKAPEPAAKPSRIPFRQRK